MAEQFEKTEQATPKHRSESRNRGQVARSQEVSSGAIIVAGLLSLAWIGPNLGHEMIHLTQRTLGILKDPKLDVSLLGPDIMLSVTPVIHGALLWILITLIAGVIANFAQVGFEFSNEALSPKFDRLNPITGFQRIFSWQSAIRAVVSILKIAVIVLSCKGIVDKVIYSDALNRATSPDELISFLHEAALSLGWRVALALAVIAVADYAYQKWNFEQGLKMSKEEVKEENKQSEGNPIVRGKIRGLMRQRHRERMSKALKTATVVVTNPTHVAVALKYDRLNMKAPKVVAKGLRLVAQKIKDLARENGVPVIENKPLARGLYKHCPIGAEIPSAFYQAMATVLAQVYRLSGKRFQET